MSVSLFRAACDCLAASGADDKVAATRAAASAWARGELTLDRGACPVREGRPGLPAGLLLVAPAAVPKRRLGARGGAAAFVHAIAHIEFNAINLAWDCIQRFRDMPPGFYADWVSVAADEAEHFTLLRARLRALGSDYGELPAHDGLWEMAAKTADDLLARMALVPRYLEARGLDVAPSMIARLERSGDPATAAVMRRILHDEIAHVAAGSRWFAHTCRARGLDPEREFIRLLRARVPGRVKGPLNTAARTQAGFTANELGALAALSAAD